MLKTKVAIVIPTIREAAITRFLKEWNKIFFDDNRFDTSLFIVEDNPKKSFAIGKTSKIAHFSWKEIDSDLKNNSWIIPRRTDCIRSYGYYKAWLAKPDFIITLDDDCYPIPGVDFLGLHWQRLSNGLILEAERWLSTTKASVRPRGLPYKQTTVTTGKAGGVILNHGLWENVPDFDAYTQLRRKKTSGLRGYSINQVIPHMRYFPMCGMNLAWKNEATPGLYFLLMGEDIAGKGWGYHRFGDIWAGIIFKKISDSLGLAVSSGDPCIWHDRASNAQVNLTRERESRMANEDFWKVVDSADLKSKTFQGLYAEMATHLKTQLSTSPYWNKTSQAMIKWAELFGSTKK